MILNIYKEKDWTSFDVVAKIKGILNSGLRIPNKLKKQRKIGHAGTLDPLAEGVLIVLTDEDTKKQDEIMTMDKEYICEISFGVESPTYDLEGPLTFNKLPDNFILENELPKHINKYIGEFEQTVPAYSAAKVKGKVLYKSARKGDVDLATLPKKKVTIYEIETMGFSIRDNLPTVKLRIVCSKGTYVRSLAHDLGVDLGVGAVLISLVRTRVGKFELKNAIKVSAIEEKLKM